MSIPPMETKNVIELRKLRDTVSASLAALGNLERPVILGRPPNLRYLKNLALARIVNGIFNVPRIQSCRLIRTFTSF